MSFVHLHVHSNYSLLYGANHVHEIVIEAKRLGYDTIALTDINNVYGVHVFLECCKEHGMRPVTGTEVRHNDMRAVLLAKDRRGFENICMLLSGRMRDKNFNFADSLAAYGRGNFVLTDSVRLLKELAGSCPDFYALITNMNRTVPELARSLGVPPVASAEVTFLSEQDRKIHRLLRAIANLSTLSTLKQDDLMNGHGFLASEKEMSGRFAVCPDALENSVKIADACRFDSIFNGWIFPGYRNKDGKSAMDVLRSRALQGAQARYGELNETVLERLDYELGIIQEKGFAAYFLVVADIVSKASRICGRGSGAASLVAYSLGITNVDPIRFNLYFERFLNPEREDPPDIDVDFAWDERDDIIDGVMEGYGRDYCAMVCNHIHFKARSAIRETARVYGIPDGEIKKVEKKLHGMSASFLRSFYNNEGQECEHASDSNVWRLAGRACENNLHLNPPWPEILAVADRITGFPRHLGVHVGGLVITPRPIEKYAPVETAAKGVPVVTWEKDGSEEAGLVKIDLLGNRSLAVVRDALASLRENGVVIDESSWDPVSDTKTQVLLAGGRTMGVFYVESPATRQLQNKTGRGDFESIVIHSSMIRPAANRFINEYVERLRGKPYEPLHPVLGDLLKETFGIMCYQEDVSKVAIALAGFSSGEADGLRKIISKKNRELKLRQYRKKFFAGARDRGVDDASIEKIWEMILSFDGYSFCKPHSASFAMVSFQSAYIKAHHPAEFLAAVISNGGGFYTAQAYVSEAHRMGVKVLPPDVNESRVRYFAGDGVIRTGFMAVSGLHAKTVESIIKERDRAGEFGSLEDLMERVRVPVSDAEALAAVGAFDSISGGLSRPQQLWTVLTGRRAAPRFQLEYEAATGGGVAKAWRGTSPLAGRDSERSPRNKCNPGYMALLRQEYERLGFLCGHHPLVFFRKELARHRVVKARDIPAYQGRSISLVGWPVTSKVVSTREGDPMEFWSFEDETDIYETVFFPRAFRQFHTKVDRLRPYIITGTVENDHGALSVNVQHVRRV